MTSTLAQVSLVVRRTTSLMRSPFLNVSSAGVKPLEVTTTNLEVIGVDLERHLVLVKGAVPGPRGGVVVLRTSVKNPMRAGGVR